MGPRAKCREGVDATKRLVMRTRAYLRLRDVLMRAHRGNPQVTREDHARRHLRGTGIEIGALTKPLRVPPGATVLQVDHKSRDALIRDDGPDLAALGMRPEDIPRIDVVDDAGRLTTFADASLDFVIANHVVEHLEDPIGGLESFMRVLRPGGVALVTLPDARFTFDDPRPRTTVEHVLRDHREGPAWSRQGHYEEWARLIEGVPEEGVASRAAAYAREDARHHFHVWELEDFLALLRAADLPCELLQAQLSGSEFIVVLRRK